MPCGKDNSMMPWGKDNSTMPVEIVIPWCPVEKIIPRCPEERIILWCPVEKIIPWCPEEKIIPRCPEEMVIPWCSVEKIIPRCPVEKIIPQCSVKKWLNSSNFHPPVTAASKLHVLGDWGHYPIFLLHMISGQFWVFSIRYPPPQIGVCWGKCSTSIRKWFRESFEHQNTFLGLLSHVFFCFFGGEGGGRGVKHPFLTFVE